MTNDNFYCLGIMNTNYIKTNKGRNYEMGICTDRIVYSHNVATSTTATTYGKIGGFPDGIKGLKYDLIFTATDFTVTSIPYHGTTDVKWEYD